MPGRADWLHHERAECDSDIFIVGLDHETQSTMPGRADWLHHERAECDSDIVF